MLVFKRTAPMTHGHGPSLPSAMVCQRIQWPSLLLYLDQYLIKILSIIKVETNLVFVRYLRHCQSHRIQILTNFLAWNHHFNLLNVNLQLRAYCYICNCRSGHWKLPNLCVFLIGMTKSIQIFTCILKAYLKLQNFL